MCRCSQGRTWASRDHTEPAGSLLLHLFQYSWNQGFFIEQGQLNANRFAARPANGRAWRGWSARSQGGQTVSFVSSTSLPSPQDILPRNHRQQAQTALGSMRRHDLAFLKADQDNSRLARRRNGQRYEIRDSVDLYGWQCADINQRRLCCHRRSGQHRQRQGICLTDSYDGVLSSCPKP